MKAFTKYTIPIYFLTIFSSCLNIKVTFFNILGEYRYQGFYGIGAHIELKEDSTFIYNWRQGLLAGTTEGGWKLKNKVLILNSHEQPPLLKEKDFEIIKNSPNSKNNYTIKVTDVDNYELICATCILLKDTTILERGIGDINGICTLNVNNQAEFIKIRYLSFKNAEIPISELNTNSITVKLKEEKPFFEYFTNRKWTIKKDRIYSPKIKKRKWIKKPYYEKIKLK